ncbi:MAG: carbohydrate kinase family protein [Jiangellales bacterium]
MTTSTALDVAVIGAVGVDTVVYPPDSWSWGGQSEGTLAEIQHVVAHGGGYAARGYAALGYRTAFVGHVGQDADGALVRATLAADGVDLSACVTSGRTAHSVNVMSTDGSRRNFYDPRLVGVQPPSESDVAGLLSRTRMVHVNIPDWARTLIEPARRRGVVVAVDVQDTPGAHDAYRLDFVRGADLLFASAAQLDDPESYARWAMTAGPASLVVMGLGPDGCLVVQRDGPAERVAVVELSPDPVTGVAPPVVDTNGAGDSLAVGVASALVIDRLPLDAAVRRGLLCARWCCSLRGSSDGLLSASMLRDGQSR